MPDTAQERQIVSRNLRTVGVLAAIFFLPLLLSFWMYYGNTWRPASLTNHGELIQPVRTLPGAELREANGAVAPANLFTEKWALAYIGNGACDETCRQALYFMRQTRLSLNNEMTRVARVFLATGTCCDRARSAGAADRVSAHGPGTLAVHHRSAWQSRHALRHAG
jgi:hypothetical protein